MHRRNRFGDRGQGLVEFAVVVPLFLLVVLAIMEFGNLFRTQLELQNGVRDGARYASVHTRVANPPPSCGTLLACTTAAVQNAAPVIGTITVTLDTTTTPCGTSTGAGPELKVTGSVSYSAITPLGSIITSFFGGAFSTPGTLSSTATFRNEC